MQNKKNCIQVLVNEHNQKKACSKIANHFLSLSTITEIYRFKFVNFLPIFGLQNFSLVAGLPQTRFA